MAVRSTLAILGVLSGACSPSPREPVTAPPAGSVAADGRPGAEPSAALPSPSATVAATVAAPAPSDTPNEEPTSPAGPDPLASKEAERATSAVLALPGVKGLCAESVARGAASCTAWATDGPTAPCASSKVSYENRECWWSVGLFEVMRYPDGSGDHANRMATFYVEPKGFQVVAASRFECADMLFSLPAFRRLEQAKRAGKPLTDDASCAGAIPYPIREAQP